MKCIICIIPAVSPSIYCLRCRAIVTSTTHERLPRRLAAITSYDSAIDAFRCRLTNVVLDLKDPSSPWYRSFVEIFPGRHEKQIMVGAMPAMLKSELRTCKRYTSAFVRELHSSSLRNQAKFPT